MAASSMFGDSTRRRIYLFVREAPRGITATEAAEHFELHPNVGRHHLDKLAAGGYVEVAFDPGEGRTGRPSKRYRISSKAAPLAFQTRRNDLLVSLLGKALSLLPLAQAEAMAEAVGEEYGRELALSMSPGDGHRSLQSALHVVADALTAHGFAAHAEARPGMIAIISDACPFGDLSTQHPVICAVDRGIVRGMLRELRGDAADSPIPEMSTSRAHGGATCVTTV